MEELKKVYDKLGLDGIIEGIKEGLQAWLQREEEYHDSDDSLLEKADSYGYDVPDISLEEIKNNTRYWDENIILLIKKLEEIGVEEEMIIEALQTATNPVVNRSYFIKDNNLHSVHLGSEEEAYADPKHLDIQIDKVKTTLEDWFKLLIEKHPDVNWAEKLDEYLSNWDIQKLQNGKIPNEITHLIYLGDNRSVDYIVNYNTFYREAKDMIRSWKQAKKFAPKFLKGLEKELEKENSIKTSFKEIHATRKAKRMETMSSTKVQAEHNPTGDYELTVHVPTSILFEGFRLKKDLEEAEEAFFEVPWPEASSLWVPKEFDGIENYLPEALSRAAVRSEEAGLQAASVKIVWETLKERIENIGPSVVCEYLGDTEAGEQEMISTRGGVVSVDLKPFSETATIVLKNPHHLINAMIAGEGMLHPDLPVDVKMTEEEVVSKIHWLDEYYPIFGDKKPQPDFDHLENYVVSDDEQYKQEIKDCVLDLSQGEIKEQLEMAQEKMGEEFDLDEAASLIETWSEGKFKKQEIVNLLGGQQMEFPMAKVETGLNEVEEGIDGRGLTDMAHVKKMVKKAEAGDEAEAAGEPDQDYDKDFYDAICKALKKEGYDCKHKEFDKYQGVYLEVRKKGKLIGTFWTQDLYFTGPTEKVPGIKYKKAVLIDLDGGEYSANPGDYFMMSPNETFKDMVLIMYGVDGKKTEIEEPKKADLPKEGEVGSPSKFVGEPDTILVVFEEDHPNSLIDIIVKHDNSSADVSELVDWIHGEEMARIESAVKSPKQAAKEAEAGAHKAQATWIETMQKLKGIYPDAERLSEKIDKIAEEEAIRSTNYTLSDGDISDDKKIEGQDVELPWHVAEGFPHADKSGYLRDCSAYNALKELAAMYPELQKWIADPGNAYLSWGETSGMMPYHHANYPDDAILILIAGEDSEEFVEMDVKQLAKDVKKKEDDKFLAFLKTAIESYVGGIYSVGKDYVTLFARTQYNYAIYYKLGEVMKIVKKVTGSEKDEDKKEHVKKLVEIIKDGAGDYK